MLSDMNGRPDAPSPVFPEGRTTGDLWCTPPKADHLMPSFGCSCALHLFVLFSPVFGTVARSTPPHSQFSQKTVSGFAFTLTPSRVITGHDWLVTTGSPTPPEPSVPQPKAEPVMDEPLPPADNRMDAADLLPLPGIVYYPTTLLTARPQPLGVADLDPPRLRPIVASGKIRLTLWIDPSGDVSRIAVDATDLPQNFVRIAIAAFEQLRFRPGELNGQKVGVIMRIEVTYDDGRLINTELDTPPPDPSL